MSVRMIKRYSYSLTEEEIERWIDDYCENTPPAYFDEEIIKEALVDFFESCGDCEAEYEDEADLNWAVQRIKERHMSEAESYEKADEIRAQMCTLREQIHALENKLEQLTGKRY